MLYSYVGIRAFKGFDIRHPRKPFFKLRPGQFLSEPLFEYRLRAFKELVFR